MAGSVTCASLYWHDGKVWTALDSRRILGSLATADTGTASAAHPHNGVITGPVTSLQVIAGTGLTVKAGAGYCVIRHPTAGQGAYLTGLMAQATLSLATADPSHPRIDLVCARIYDLGSSSSNATVEVVTGTPATSPVAPSTPSAAIPLATVAVAATATVPGTITDLRNWTAPPGGIIPVASAAAAPAAASSQVLYNQATGKLCRGSGTAGTVLALASAPAPVLWVVNTSAGATGLTPGLSDPGDPVYWGIGYGAWQHYLTTDGTAAREISVTFTADGTSDYELSYKWQLAVPVNKLAGGTLALDDGQVIYQLSLDGAVVDTVAKLVADTPALHPGGGGCASWFTSAALGTRPSRGTHTAALSVVTARTRYSSYCGVTVGDMHSNAARYGALSGWAAALTAEYCYLAVKPVPA